MKKLGGCDKLYRLKLEADYLAELTYIGAARALWRPAAGACAGTYQLRVARDEDDGFPRLLPHRAGLYQCCASRVERVRGAGTWVGGRFCGGLLFGYHEDRSRLNTICCLSVS